MNRFNYIFQLFLLLIFSCQNFAYEKNITGNYYLLGVDTENNLTISRKLSNGDYIGRIPAKVLAYGLKDSFLVAKMTFDEVIKYYVIDMKKDSEYALEENFLFGPMTEQEFKKLSLPINFIKLK